MNIISNLFNHNKDNDEYGYEGEQNEYMDETNEDRPHDNYETKPANRYSHQSNKMQVVIIEPKNFEAAEKIAESLRQLKPVIINFEETDAHVASRIVDFVSGSTYSLDGKLEKIGKDIFIVAPSNVTVDFFDKGYTEVNNTLAGNWKE